jgi:hypothetical protein
MKLIKNQIIQKFQNLEILKEWVAQEKSLILLTIWQKNYVQWVQNV